MKRIASPLLLILIILTMAVAACNLWNNNESPTLSAPGSKVTPPSATQPRLPALTQSALAVTKTSTSATKVTPQPTTSGAQPDKGSEVEKLLDDLDNALKNMDTMDDVK